MGHEFVTIQRLQVIGVDLEKNFLLIKGAVPGTNKGTLLIKNTVKKVKVHHHEAVHKSKKKAPSAPAAKEVKPKK
jgi:ribosomal protein L3